MAKVIVGIFTLSVIVSILVYTFFLISPKNIVESDFASFVTGAEIVKRGEGIRLYDIKLQEDVQKEIIRELKKNIFLPYRSLPFMSLLFLPFTYLDLITGYKVFAFVNILILCGISFLVSKSTSKFKNISVILILPFLFLANINTVFYAQLTIILTSLLALIYIKLNQKKTLLAGILLGFLLIKPQYLISLPFFLLMSDQRTLLVKGFLVSFFLLFSTSFIVAGTDFVGNYINLISHTETIEYGSNFGEMYSLPSLSLYLTGNLGTTFIITSATYLIFIYFFLFFSKSWTAVKKFVFIIIATLFLAPHILTHDLSVLTLPLLYVSGSFFNLTEERNAFLILLVIFLIPFTSLWPANLVAFNVILLSSCLFLVPYVKM